MNIITLQRRLRRLGCKVCELGVQTGERWVLWVTSCGHTIYAMGKRTLCRRSSSLLEMTNHPAAPASATSLPKVLGRWPAGFKQMIRHKVGK